MSDGWFETVAEAQRRARRQLPPSVYGALVAGSEKGVTVTDNIGAFSELGFAPHVAGLSAQRDLALRHPRWLLGYAKTGKVPDPTVPNMTGRGEPAPTFFGAYRQWAASPLPTWEDVRWLAKQWGRVVDRVVRHRESVARGVEQPPGGPGDGRLGQQIPGPSPTLKQI